MAVRPAVRDRRTIERNRKRIGVRYGTSRPEFLGYTCDFGKNGLFLQGNNLFPPGTVLVLDLDLPEGPRSVRGTIRWVKEVPPAFRRRMRGAIRIEIVHKKRHRTRRPLRTNPRVEML